MHRIQGEEGYPHPPKKELKKYFDIKKIVVVFQFDIVGTIFFI
jgi:hypothetical protein